MEDSPQVRALVNVFGSDATALKEYVMKLHQLTSKVVAAHNMLTTCYQDLSRHLKHYSNVKFPIESDSEGMIATTFQQYSSHLSEMSSWEHIVATQIADGAVYPLSRFIDTELHEMETMGSLYQTAGLDLERATTRYSKCRRKDPEQEHRESCEDVYVAKKKFHQMALHYYSKLNLLQYSRRSALVEPMLGLMVATRGHFNMGRETFNNKDMENFLSNTSINIKSVEDEQKKDREDTLELIDSIITQSQLMYYAELPSDVAALPPDTTLNTKSGYLNVQRKYMGVMSSWERQFVFLEGGNLMGAMKGDLVGQLLMEIDSSTLVHAADTDDRRHVFQVISSKKCVTLQALNDRERDEWMLTIHNCAKDGGYVKDDKIQQPGLFSEMGQFIADKLAAAQSAIGNTPGGGSVPTSPTSTSGGASPFPADTPIVFDLANITDTDSPEADAENAVSLSASAGSEAESAPDTTDDNNTPTFTVRFLGSMGINVDRVKTFIIGQSVVCEVMRRILAARAIHNVFSTNELKLRITGTHVSLIDANSSNVRLRHNLSDLAYWAAHTENQKLVGYIVRQNDGSESNMNNFSCFVFEADQPGKDICSALGVAAKHAYKELLEKKTKEKKRKSDTRLLLDNIASLPDIGMDEVPQITSDGQYLLLEEEYAGLVAAGLAPGDESVLRSPSPLAPTEEEPISEA